MLNQNAEKIILLVLTFTSLLSPNAQTDYSWEMNNWQNIHYHAAQSKVYPMVIDSFALENKIYQIKKSASYTEKHNSFRQTVVTFDKFGRMINRLDISDTGIHRKIIRYAQRSFNQEGLTAQNSVNSNWKKSRYSHFFVFGDSNKLIETTYYNHKNNFSGRQTISYHENGKRSELIQWNSHNKILYSYRYHYFSNGQIKQIILTGRKGKTIRVTDYTCDETGKTLKKMKDTIRICSVKSYLPDGSIVTTTQSFNYKGEPQKSIEIRNGKDQLISYELYQGINEKLLYSYAYTYMNNKLIANSFKNYGDKKHPFTRTTTFDESGKIMKDESVTVIKRSKQNIRRNEFIYNEKGMIISERNFEDTLLKCNILFIYTFY